MTYLKNISLLTKGLLSSNVKKQSYQKLAEKKRKFLYKKKANIYFVRPKMQDAEYFLKIISNR